MNQTNKAITVVYGMDERQMTLQLLEAANAASKLSLTGAIGLKPNLVLDSPANQGATTHPGIARGVLEYLRDFGAKDLYILEGSWIGASTRRAFDVCGYSDLARHFGVRLIDTKQDKGIQVDSPIGKLRVCQSAIQMDAIINLPVLKGHCQTRMTCGLKNLKGLVPDDEKRRFHTMGLMQPIAALAAVLRPQITLVDSICGDLDFEEGGTPVETGRMLMGEDPVQLDAYCAGLMGLTVEDVPYIGLAQQYGVGNAAWLPNHVVQLGAGGQQRARKPTGRVQQLMHQVQAKDACSACYGTLAHALHRAKQEGIPVNRQRIYVGQGYRKQKGEGLGIGNCCKGFDSCVPGCPPTATQMLSEFVHCSEKQKGLL